MGERVAPMIHPSQSCDAGEFDLTQYYRVFFDEAGDNLATMETLLLAIGASSPDRESLDAVFRCAHSIKGGAATFGFRDLADLTHVMETLLDGLRRDEIGFDPLHLELLLRAVDALRSMLASHRGSEGGIDASALVGELRAVVAQPRAFADSPDSRRATVLSQNPIRRLGIRIGPLAREEVARELVALFEEIPGLGEIADDDEGTLDADACRSFVVTTRSSDDELLELFGFHVAREQVAIRLLDGDPLAAPAQDVAGDPRPQAPNRAVAGPEHAMPVNDLSTLRVPVEKVDQLVNLVGELVITQAMLAQSADGAGLARDPRMALRLADLERQIRQMQEAVMAIRMIPVAVVFSRFPRMLHDLAPQLGKRVALHTSGESTELDKGMIEKITDPLTHLVRNALDHGIEPPGERVARGKPEIGAIGLSARQRGASIEIEVRDDGRGLDRTRILEIARERGIPASERMPDAQVWQLIFVPGFSTATAVSEISGRGVGMDVVRRNVVALGGSVDVESQPGAGTRVVLRMPLTLAIMDAMSVAVGDEVYVIPVASVIESVRLDSSQVRSIAGMNCVIEVRGEFLPVVPLDEAFGISRAAGRADGAIMIVAEAECGRVALLVDELVAQQQVVVKNIETNYRKVPGVSAATILGDGRVALILDIAHFARRTRH